MTEKKPPRQDNSYRFASIYAQLSKLIADNPVLRIAIPFVLLVLVLLAVMAIRNTIGSVQSSNETDLQATAMVLAAPSLRSRRRGRPCERFA